MITAHKLYVALKEAQGVSDDAATAAAEELAEFLHLREDVAVIKADVLGLRNDVAGLRWMFGVTWALLLVVVGAVLQVLVPIAGAPLTC